jgi:arylsulfatase A
MRHLALLTSLSLAFCAAASIGHSAPPNIVLIMADDFGYECVSANGGQSYQTPHLDRLAATGLRFQHCHAQPLCTPTRVQLMTGRYNLHNYLQFGVLPRTETTFAHLLKQAGYATAVCGKWQLGHEPDSPQHFGFDESLLWQQTRRPPRYANAALEHQGLEKTYPSGSYGPQLINDFALDFITRHQDRPFFLYYPMILTHDPFQPTPDSPDWDPTAVGEHLNKDPKNFAAMTAFMDKMIGRLDAKLSQLGIRDNTLLLFLGDNGTHSTITSQFQGKPYPGGKGSTTARGTHVPLIVSWPAVITQGRISRDLISTTDFLPTFCAASNIPIPADIDGISFLPQLRGESTTPRDWLYTWYSPRQKADLTVRECVFDHHHKLYRSGDLFDLQTDPFEQSPLPPAAITGPIATKAAKLQAVLDQFANARPQRLDDQFKNTIRDPRTKKSKKGEPKPAPATATAPSPQL